MALTPSGKMRLMQAQTINSKEYHPDIYRDFGMEKPVQPEQQENIPKIDANELEDGFMDKMNIPDQAQKEHQDKGIKDFVFHKLQEWGYPPRRLVEFKNKFAEISIDADFNRQVSIQIPDKKYGSNEQIDQDELSKFVKEVEKKFKLYFERAENKEGKWNIDFTSIDTSIPEEGEEIEETHDDNLDEVYGKADRTKPAKKKAMSLSEMIKTQKTDVATQLLKIINGANK